MAMLFLLMRLTSDDSMIVVRSSWAWNGEQCGGSIMVQQPQLFDVGDRVLLHLPVCHHTGDSESHNAGAWTWNLIDTIVGTRIYLTFPIAEPLNRVGYMQIIRAVTPEKSWVGKRVIPQPWNGLHGGVVAIWCDDTLHVDSPISTTGTGFYQPASGWNTSDTTSWLDDSTCMTRPGDGSGPCSRSGRGLQFSTAWQGGSRGIAHNSGGAGGGGAGYGGMGGATSTAYAPIYSAEGASARPLNDGSRLLFGSSGGAGHGNDLDGGRGGRGGGIIIVRARHIQFHSGSVISADGTNGHDASHDGSGGGGAGGMVVLDAESIAGEGRITTRGGHGGSSHSTMFLCGPGGGGAGGSILSTSALPASVHCIVKGGSAGVASATRIDSTADRGAANGGDGTQIQTIARWKPPTVKNHRMRLRQADTVVNSQSTTLLWTEGAVATEWLDSLTAIGSDSATTPPIGWGRWFHARMTRADGCKFLDSVFVRPVPQAPTIFASIGDAHASPGDSVNIYLSVRSPYALQRAIEGVAYVSTHSRVLLPVTSSAYVSDSRTHIDFPFRLGAMVSSTYRRDQLRAVLGDSASVELRIDSVVLNDASIGVQSKHGRFTLDGICIQGGRMRLFTPVIDVSIRGREIITSANELVVTDILGRTIAHHRTTSGRGLSISLDPVLHGLIFIVVIDGTAMRTVPVWTTGE